jgi:hypothetical protein
MLGFYLYLASRLGAEPPLAKVGGFAARPLTADYRQLVSVVSPESSQLFKFVLPNASISSNDRHT